MSNEKNPSSKGSPSKDKMNSLKEAPNAGSHISHVIGIISGKGGVGKSFVTGSLANMMASKGYRVGILDADITGPSIPRMYGVKGPATGTEGNIKPLETRNGIKVMSINLLLPTEDTPVIWRGPILASMVKQFWTDVVWGDLDYLFVDMPPGTGDVPLTVFQSLPIDGAFIVASPQDLVKMIVMKAYKMARMMMVPVLGVVENYSYLLCPDCGRKISVFGDSHIAEIVEEIQVPLIGQIPIDHMFTEKADAGAFDEVVNTYLEAAQSVLPAV